MNVYYVPGFQTLQLKRDHSGNLIKSIELLQENCAHTNTLKVLTIILGSL